VILLSILYPLVFLNEMDIVIVYICRMVLGTLLLKVGWLSETLEIIVSIPISLTCMTSENQELQMPNIMRSGLLFVIPAYSLGPGRQN